MNIIQLNFLFLTTHLIYFYWMSNPQYLWKQSRKFKEFIISLLLSYNSIFSLFSFYTCTFFLFLWWIDILIIENGLQSLRNRLVRLARGFIWSFPELCGIPGIPQIVISQNSPADACAVCERKGIYQSISVLKKTQIILNCFVTDYYLISFYNYLDRGNRTILWLYNYKGLFNFKLETDWFHFIFITIK